MKKSLTAPSVWISVCLFVLTLSCLSFTVVAQSGNSVVAWGGNDYGQASVPPGLTNGVAVSAGWRHNLVLNSDGTVACWGYDAGGPTNIPAGLSGVAAIAASDGYNMVLKSNGTVAAWGAYNSDFHVSGLSNITAIAAGWYHWLALKPDGTFATWGAGGASYNPATNPPALSDVIAVAAGIDFSVVLRTNGTVVAWGWNIYNQTNVPAGLSNVVAIAAGYYHTLALKADGTVVAWGNNGSGQSAVPAGLSNVIAVAAGAEHSLALKADGTVTAWGAASYGQSTVPPGLSNVVAISAGETHSLALTSGGVLPPTLNCTPAPEGLVGWWPGEGNTLDLAATNNGVLVGDMSYGAGEAGLAFLSNSTNGPGVRIPSNPILDVGAGEGFTLEAWIRPEDVSLRGPIFEWNPGDGTTYWGVHFHIDPFSFGAGPGTLYANIVDSAGWHQIYAPGVLTNGVFQHVALTYDKATGMAKLYRNGAVVAQQYLGVFTPVTTSDLYLGRRPLSPAAEVYSFLGSIDEPAVYNRVLSASDIADIYLAGSAGKCLSISPTYPIIVTQPSDATVEVGTNVMFPVVASGAEPLSYQWRFNGNPLAGATNSTLFLTGVQTNDSGAYSVVVTNVYGAITSSNALLTVVIFPPAITAQPQSRTVLVGNTVIFSVGATGTAPLRYQWLFNGASLDGATASTLTLTNVQLTDSGNYSVIIANAGGSVPSANALLTVNPQCTPAPAGLVSWWTAEGNALDIADGNHGILTNGAALVTGKVGRAFSLNGSNSFVKIPQAPNLNVGSQVTIEFWMKANPSNAMNTYQGLVTSDFYGIEIANGFAAGPLGVNFFISTDGGAAVSPDSFPDTATVNGGGAVVSAGVWHHVAGTYDGIRLQLYIDGQPWGIANVHTGPISPMLANSFVTIGSEDGRTTWPEFIGPRYFNGLLDEVSLYNRALSAAEIQAIYAAGVTGKCPLPPRIVVQPANQTVEVGDAATFTVVAAGTPPLSYQWMLNGQYISGATNAALVVYNAHPVNWLTNYSVRVANVAGSIVSSNATISFRASSGCVSPPAGLVSWWRFENDVADNWDSNNGMSYYGYTLSNYFRFSPGKVGQALFLPYAYVQVPDSTSLRLTNALTIEAWVYPTNLTGTTPRTIVSKFEYGSPFVPAVVSATNSSYYLGLTNGRPCLIISATGSSRTNTTLVGVQALPTNQWSHVAATYNGAALALFVNGSLVAQTNYSAGIFPGTAPLGIGAIAYGSSSGTSPFMGFLDEVDLYNRALTPAEIAAIYGAGSSGKCLAAPVITAQPQSRAIPLGEDVKFTVGIYGNRPLKYQWRYRSQTGASTLVSTNADLILEKVATNRAGTYFVTVSNTLGSVTSSNFTLTLLPAPVCTPPPAGMISWWPADGSVRDAVGDNHALANSYLTFNTGKVDRAFGFISSYSAGTYAPSPKGLDFGSNVNFSIEAWIKTTNYPGNSRTNLNMTIVDKTGVSIPSWPTTSGVAGYSLSLYDGRLAFWMGTPPLRVGYGTNETKYVAPGEDLRDGMYHHVAVTLDRDSTVGGKLWVDGQVVLIFNPVARIGSLSNSSALYIGNTVIRNAYASSGAFYGWIDELTFYNRALEPGEIQAIAAAGSKGKCKEPPVIVTQPASLLVQAGQTAAFNVEAAGTPRLRYQWRRGGVNLAGATNATCTITNAQSSLAGLYSVLVTNGFGFTLSSNAVLTVNNPPIAICHDTIVAADSNCVADASVIMGNCVTDPDGDPITITQIPAGPYPLGTNAVVLTVADNRGGSNSYTASVIVLDRTPPVIVCTDVAATNDLDQCGAVVTFPLPVVLDACSAVASVTCNPPAGSFFPCGLNTVTCTATDAAGNATNATFTVTVRDAQPPVITCPADIVVTNAHDAWTSVVTFTPTASDNCPGVGTPVCTPASGSVFGLGTNAVTCSVTDAAGNSSLGTFNVIVQPGNQAPVPVIDITLLARFPGLSNLFVIAPDNRRAKVILDGSDSSDPDGDTFSCQWYLGTNLFSTNLVATNVLRLGTNRITLFLDDSFPLGTNSTTAVVAVITPARAVGIILDMVDDSRLSRRDKAPLEALLRVAADTFQRGQFRLGVVQLLVFQNVVRKTIARHDAILARDLIEAARQIIIAEVSALPMKPLPPGHSRFDWDRHGGKFHLRFAGRNANLYVIQASTDLVNWQVVGASLTEDDSVFEFEDADSTKLPARFYRIMQP